MNLIAKNLLTRTIPRASIRLINIPKYSYQIVPKFKFSTQDEKDPVLKMQSKLTEQNAQHMIQKWVKSNKVLLFMKGTPSNPQCGYSNFVVQLLKKYGLNEYKAINILSDPIIREQVKIYSKWPTYPQLYIDGQLIGGSDILHEMHKDQSLHKLLQEKQLI